MTYYFLTLIIACLFVFNIFILRNKSFKQKVIITIGTLVGGLVLLLATMIVLWNSSENPRMREDPCVQSIPDLVRNSSLESPFKKDLQTAIEKEENENIMLKLFVQSSGPEYKENIIGWVIIDLKNKLLLDITNDVENPISLTYTDSDWQQFINCHTHKQELKGNIDTSRKQLNR